MELNINNITIKLKKPATVLEIARENNIYIPSLCAHPELSPHGGCRLCIIEIEGWKGYPSACTTIAQDGMIVRTESNTLQKMRKDLLRLIMSEHPAGCLMCTDVDGCSSFQGTIRKVGVTTGCRWCPKDADCEFQKLVEAFDIQEAELPDLYRDIPLEKYDPFFDRDYNLCIYCDRCVRICNEYRLSSILSLKQRGKETTIGPAFDASHIEANCEFCGACVSVCPTGAMSEKSRKWWGLPEKYFDSVCPGCSMNCDIQVLTLKDKIVGTIPPGIPHEAGGELCVKGRFCLSELVNRTKRILEPEYKYKEGYGIVNWEFALEKAAELIKGTKAKRSALLLSPSLSLEELFKAEAIAKNILKTKDISSSVIDKNTFAFMRMAVNSVKLKDLDKAKSLVSFFLNGNYNFAPLSLKIKKSANSGKNYVQVGWTKDTTSRFAQTYITPNACNEHAFLENVISGLKDKKNVNDRNRAIIEALQYSKPAVIVGPEIMSLNNCISLLDKINQIIELTNAMLYMPNPYGNLTGMFHMMKLKTFDDMQLNIDNGKYDLLYLIGDNPFQNRPNVKHIIYQNAFPAGAESQPDIILPTALWGETSGSYLSSDKKIKKTKAVSEAHGYALSHLEVFKRLSKILKISLSNFKSKELKVKTKQLKQKASKSDIKLKSPTKKHPFVLIQEKALHTYSNLNLCIGIAGFGELVKTEHVLMHPKDAKKLKLEANDNVELISAQCKNTYPIVIRKQITPGYVYLPGKNGEFAFESNPCPINIKKKHV